MKVYLAFPFRKATGFSAVRVRVAGMLSFWRGTNWGTGHFFRTFLRGTACCYSAIVRRTFILDRIPGVQRRDAVFCFLTN
jgi:hypothetical protein